MSARNGAGHLPRLGDAKAPAKRRQRERVEVELEDRGVSVVLYKPRVPEMAPILDALEPVEGHEANLVAVAALMIEPDWDVDKLRGEVESWTFRDWSKVLSTAMELTGLGGLAAAAAGFQSES